MTLVTMNEADLRTLLKIVLALEGEMLAENIDQPVIDHMTHQLQAEQLLAAHAGAPELRLALANLALRLHAALGDGATYPGRDDGRTIHRFAFPTLRDAAAFAHELNAEQPWIIEGDNVVAVTMIALPLSVRFREQEQQFNEAAKRHAGQSRGWESAPHHG